MPEILDESTHLESHTVNIYRTAATVKGGRRFSFGALVVVGDHRGKIGYGYGKSTEVPSAIEKAQRKGKRQLMTIPKTGSTIPHEVEGRFAACRVRLIPASPGTGVVAGGTVRAVLEMAGITDCLTKCFGSTNKLNTVKAVMDGFSQLRTKESIAELRGVDLGTTDIEERVERGRAFMPSTGVVEKMAAPVNTVGQERRGGRGGGGGRGGPRGGGGGRGGPRGGEGFNPSGAPDASDSGPSEGGESKPSNS